jgi:hypothetical protein
LRALCNLGALLRRIPTDVAGQVEINVIAYLDEWSDIPAADCREAMSNDVRDGAIFDRYDGSLNATACRETPDMLRPR